MLRSRDLDQWVLAGIVVLAGLADQVRIVQLGGLSGLAALTLVECGLVWCCWLRQPWSPLQEGGILCLLLFNMWVLGTLFWAPATLTDIPVLAVSLLFLGLVLLAVREGYRNPGLPRGLGRAMDWMSAAASAICLVRVLQGETEPDSPTNPRSVVLVVLMGLCYQLAAWQHGQRGQRGRLLAAGGMVVLIILTLSRMASAVAIMLFPMVIVFGGRRRISPTRVIQIAVIGGGLVSCLFLYEPFYERIFGSTSLTDIHTEGVNTSGRMEMWEDIVASFQKHMWLGQGVGATRPYTDRPGMYHPHNDYLLLAHDYGLFGLGLFLLGLGSIAVRLARFLRRTGAAATPPGPGDTLCLTGLLSVLMLLLSMATDNSINYGFVMAPIGVLLGASIAHCGRTWRVDVRSAVPPAQRAMEGPLCRS